MDTNTFSSQLSDFSQNGKYKNKDDFIVHVKDTQYNLKDEEGNGNLPSGYLEPDPDYDDVASNRVDSSCLSVFTRFAEKTSMQGVPNVYNSKLVYAKILWTILLILSVCAMGLHLFYLIDQFLKYPVQTKIKLGFSNLQVPAVTICNMNVVRKNSLHLTSEAFQELVAFVEPRRIFKDNQKGRRKRFVKEFGKINFTDYGGNVIGPSQPGKLGTPKDEIAMVNQLFTRLYMEHSRTERFRIGHHIDDMLVSCSFAGQKCYASNFTLFQTENYGNCWKLESDQFIETAPGYEEGLDIVLFMENNEALAGISSGYGIRVNIHEQNTLPFPTEEGFLVSTAFETHIALKKIDILRSDGNHGDCNTYADFEAEYGYKFTRQLCLALCLQDEMLERCGCHSSTLEEYRVKLHKNHTRMCRSKSDRECEALVKLEQRRRLVPCRCTNPCKETRYSRVITARQWPTDEYANILVASVCEQRPEVCNHIVNKKKDSRSLSQDFLRLTIYYEDLNYEEMYETPEIEVQQFASDVGGAIGLWIGLSILSVFELVQLAMELCVVGKRKLS